MDRIILYLPTKIHIHEIPDKFTPVMTNSDDS